MPGAKLFAKLTGDHLPDTLHPALATGLGIILDGELFSAPNIQSTISNQGKIAGSFSKEEAEEIADSLNASSLPVQLRRAEKPAEPHATLPPPAEPKGEAKEPRPDARPR